MASLCLSRPRPRSCELASPATRMRATRCKDPARVSSEEATVVSPWAADPGRRCTPASSGDPAAAAHRSTAALLRGEECPRPPVARPREARPRPRPPRCGGWPGSMAPSSTTPGSCSSVRACSPCAALRRARPAASRAHVADGHQDATDLRISAAMPGGVLHRRQAPCRRWSRDPSTLAHPPPPRRRRHPSVPKCGKPQQPPPRLRTKVHRTVQKLLFRWCWWWCCCLRELLPASVHPQDGLISTPTLTHSRFSGLLRVCLLACPVFVCLHRDERQKIVSISSSFS